MATGKPWIRDDLLVAMHLYCQMPFGQFHSRNPVIITMAERMGRTASSLAMKLCNLASLDPAHQQRGVSGLKGVSQADRAMWSAFQADWQGMAEASTAAIARIAPAQLKERELPHDRPTAYDRPTETTATVRVRRGQDFFRATVLTAYGRRCCLTGCDVEGLLVASHIVPWAEQGHEAHRLNPRNGLCLAALQDRAFDQGYIGLDDGLRVIVSTQLRRHAGNPAVKTTLLALESTLKKGHPAMGSVQPAGARSPEAMHSRICPAA